VHIYFSTQQQHHNWLKSWLFFLKEWFSIHLIVLIVLHIEKLLDFSILVIVARLMKRLSIVGFVVLMNRVSIGLESIHFDIDWKIEIENHLIFIVDIIELVIEQ
jgi:hypothetical protein